MPRLVQKTHQPTETVKQFQRYFTDGDRGPFCCAWSNFNFILTEKIPDNRHFQLQRQREAGFLLARFHDPSHHWESDGCQKIMSATVRECLAAHLYSLPSLRGQHQARFVGH